MKTPAWYKGVSPNFTSNKYMWVNGFDENGKIDISYSERVDVNDKYTNFGENRETQIRNWDSIRLCTQEEINEIHKLRGDPIINNSYSII